METKILFELNPYSITKWYSGTFMVDPNGENYREYPFNICITTDENSDTTDITLHWQDEVPEGDIKEIDQEILANF
jgi:hypothetical protein